MLLKATLAVVVLLVLFAVSLVAFDGGTPEQECVDALRDNPRLEYRDEVRRACE